MNQEIEIRNLIKLHDILKGVEDCYYAHYMKDWIELLRSTND